MIPFYSHIQKYYGSTRGDQAMEHLLLFPEVTAGSHRVLSRPAAILGLKRQPTARQVSRDPRGPGGTDLTLQK